MATGEAQAARHATGAAVARRKALRARNLAPTKKNARQVPRVGFLNGEL